MNITPIGNVYLLNVPLTADNKNQLDFENAEKQYEYFFSRKVAQFNIEDATYIRKDGIFYLPFHIDELWNVNYLMYKNSNFSNKWFYAFIIGMEYENDNTTKIKIQTDVFQTWAYNYEILDSFIEREMIDVVNDVPGANLLPEGLELGELKIDGTASLEDLSPIPVIAYSGDKIPQEQNGNTPFDLFQACTVNGIPSSVSYIILPSFNEFEGLMACLNNSVYLDYVISAFTVPKLAVSDFFRNDLKIGIIYTAYALQGVTVSQSAKIFNELVATPATIDGYFPRNQKLRTYPYLYLGYNPPNGSSKIYRYEDFTNGKPSFKIISEVNPNPSICFIPRNYRGKSGDNLSDMASLNGYPLLSTRTDYFNSWLAQNSNIISLNMQQETFNYEIGQRRTTAEGVSNIINSAIKMNVGSAITDSISMGFNLAQADVNHDFYIKQQMAQVERQKLIPDQVNLGSSNATLLRI